MRSPATPGNLALVDAADGLAQDEEALKSSVFWKLTG